MILREFVSSRWQSNDEKRVGTHELYMEETVDRINNNIINIEFSVGYIQIF